MTNYERIKNMSVEEMADAIINTTDTCELCVRSNCVSCVNAEGGCTDYIKQWLESEVETE